MTSCFLDLPPINPLSQLLLDTLGENFFPPFSAQFQPVDTSKLTEEPLLQMQLPGGGAIKPIGDPLHTHLSEYVTPLIGSLGTIFSFFAPLFLILDVIRAIIDIICALFNPVPLILSVVDLFVAVLPPVVALFPPFASILLAINTAKLITALIGALGSSLIPIAVEVVEVTVLVGIELAKGNISVVDAATLKICQLLQEFANKLGGLLPISFILKLIDFFMNIGSKFFCTNQSPCCTTDNCPPIIINPPGGIAKVVRSVEKFTLKDLIELLFNAINIPLGIVSDLINDTIGPFFGQISSFLNNVVDVIVNVLDALNVALGGVLSGIINTLNLGSLNIELGPIDIKIPIPDIFGDVILVQPETEFEMFTAVSTPNANGLSSATGVGHTYHFDELSQIPKYVVEPDKIPAPGSDPDPASMRVRLGSSGEVLQRVRSIEGLNFVIRDDTFPLGDEVNYVFVPDEINLIKLELIGLGCHSDIQKAKGGLDAFIQADAGATVAGSGGAPVLDKIGEQEFPKPPVDELNQLLDQLTQDPKTAVDPTPIINKYLDDLAAFTDKLLCVGASSVKSTFTISKPFAQPNEGVVLTFTVNDQGGNPLLIGGVLPSSSFTAQFYTTFGEVSPVVFNSTTGTFTATLSSPVPGKALLQAAFFVRNKECMRAKNFDGFSVTPGLQEVEFIPERSAYPRTRRKDQFVQSRGGRARR